MIDLHLHTTVSDGLFTPSELIANAAAAGLTVVSVTDHDTVAGLAEARAAAQRIGLTFVDGIEITAVEGDADVHVLGYFFDAADPDLAVFLQSQRADRLRRVLQIADRLRVLGCPIDTRPLALQGECGGASIGRPHVADALVAAGHARDRTDAFDRLIGRGRPAYVSRLGAVPADVVSVIRCAGGIASMAHPGLTRRDDLLESLSAAGLAAVEAVHSDHDAGTVRYYRELASRLNLLVSGGSDFHGDTGRHCRRLGGVTLPEEDFEKLRVSVS